MPRVPKYNDLSQFEKPEVTWDFYEAIHRSKPTKAAIEAGTNSIEEENLDKYVKQTLRMGKMSSLAGFLSATEKKNPYAHLPSPFDKLIPLQNVDGRWYPLKKVLRILRLPKDTVLEKATIWEMASAFVLAYIRQKIDMFHLTQEFHDKAIVHFPTQELIVQAKEIILVNDLTLDLREVMRSRGVVPQPDSRYDYSDDEVEDSITVNDDSAVDETIGNQAMWTPKTGGLLEHTNADLSSDPFMQIPNQQEYERMTAEKVQKSGTGALPRAKMTTMVVLGEDEALCKEAYEMDSDLELEGNDSLTEASQSQFGQSVREDPRGVTFAPSMNMTLASSDHTETDGSTIKSALKGSTPRPGSSNGKVTFQMVDGERPRLVGEEAFDKLDYRLVEELSITTPPAFSETSLERLEDGNGSKASKQSSSSQRSSGDGENKDKERDGATGVEGKQSEKSEQDKEEIIESEKGDDVPEQSETVDPAGMSITPTALDGLDALSKAKDVDKNGETPTVDESVEESKSEPAASPVKSTTTFDATQLGKPQRDEAKISAAQEVLDRIMIDAVLACEEIERHCDLIKDCLAKSIIEYNETLTYDERNLTFDQLTAMLGDDCPPREGFLDWRRQGCPGMRPKVVRFMNLIYDMAVQRLRVTELETPEGRPVGMPDIVPLDREWLWDDGKEEDCDDIGRWSFVWNGEDMVKKVLHSLDFLRNQRELCNWYGRTFFFTANPLMLPFHIYPNHAEFEMNHYLKETLMTKPHMRPMCSIGGTGYTLVGVAPGSPTWDKCSGDIESLGQKDAWKFEKYLRNKWKVSFEECCEGAYSNWPNVPKIKQEADMDAMFKAFMVIHLRCKKTLISTYRWEKKFISLLSTIRGQYLMKGQSGLKPDLNMDRETEQKLIVLKEEHARKMEEQRRLEEERTRMGHNANTGFLNSLMKASTGAPMVKIKTFDEIDLERKMKERRRILKALMQPREYPNPDEMPLYLPFENWSSVNLNRPGSPNLGFGRSPTRSPTTVALPQLAPLVPGSPLLARTAIEHKTMRITLEEEAIAAARGPIDTETLSPTKTGGGDSDDEGEDGDGEGTNAGPKSSKKSKNKKKGKGDKRGGNLMDGKGKVVISKGGTRALEGLLPQGEKLSRAIITQAAMDSSKVSRYVAPSSSQNYTRKSNVEALPAVRKGGGALQQQLPRSQPNRLPKAMK